MSRTNELRHIKWQKACKCKCRLDASVSNNKQCWNKDKCKFECKGFNWNPCECECNKSSNIGKYLEYENCKYTGRFINKLAEECNEKTDRSEMICNGAFKDYKKEFIS